MGIETNARPRLMTVNDAARYLAVSVSTLYGWVYQRRISFVKVGRALRFELVDLDSFIQRNRTQAR
jgi:excisionase family DNA binding protein